MITQHTSHSSIRAFIIAVALLIASVLATSSVSADTLRPAVDLGAPGGGGGIAGTLDETARSADLIALSPDASTDVADSRGIGVSAF